MKVGIKLFIILNFLYDLIFAIEPYWTFHFIYLMTYTIWQGLLEQPSIQNPPLPTMD